MNVAHPLREHDTSFLGKQVGEATLLLITAIAFYLCWLLARPFLAAMTWALALAVVGYPLHRRLERGLRPNLAALLAVVAITAILLAPGGFLLQKLFDEAGSSLATFGTSLNTDDFHRVAGRYSFTEKLLGWAETKFDMQEEVRRGGSALASLIPAAVRGSLRMVTQFAIMLVMLFYFLRDRDLLLQFLGGLLPLSTAETTALLKRISATIYATLYGNLVVKLVQGTLGGLMFWVLGLPAPVLFGSAMAAAAMLPIVGTSFIWGPAAVYLLIQGSWIKAMILVVWGGLVVSLIDNLLYPILVAGELRIHTLGILVSIFGGLIVLGIAGVVLGPVILACTIALLDVWRVRKATTLLDPAPQRP